MKFRDRGLALRIALAAVAFAAMAWGFRALFLQHMPPILNDPAEDMSFALFVPMFSLYVLWTERKKVVESIGEPGVGGLLLALPGLAAGFLGTRGAQVRLEIVGFVCLLVAVTWALFGRRTAKATLFPFLFLLFCLPLATFLDVVTVHLRLLASSTAFGVLRGFGAEVVRRGTMIGALDGSFAIDVAEPCSGLRSIFALMALTAAYAYFNQPTWLRRAVLFAASVPIAVLGNVVRILSICLVAQYASGDFAMGFYHDYSGYVVFAVAIVLMVAVGEAMKRFMGPAPKAGSAAAESVSAPAAGGFHRFVRVAVPAALLVLVVPAMVCQSATPEVTVAEAPEVHLGEIPGYESAELGPGEAELNVLPADTRIEKRMYTAPDGSWFQVTLVVGGKSKSSIHRPELCLPAQGFQMTSPRTESAGGRSWRFITLASKDAPPLGFAYTFFNQEGYKTASHTARIFRDVWDRSVRNRIDRWVMVTVNSSDAGDEPLSAIAERLKGFLP